MANGCYATYHSQDFDYISFTDDFAPVFVEGALERYERKIAFSAHFVYANYAAWATGQAAIIAALEVPGQTLTIKDTATNTLITFQASDCIGDGPNASFRFRDFLGYTFWVDVEITGGVEPGGGAGTPVDTYTDTYDHNQQDRATYTRTGTQRVTSAYSSIDAALDAVDPLPSGKWELLSRTGTLDEDGKLLEYSIVYIEYFEALPSEFASLTYNLSSRRDGRLDDISLTATGGVNYDRGDIESMAQLIENWGKAKLGQDAKILDISTSADKRNGTVSLVINAKKAVSGDLVEFEESVSTSRVQDYVIRKRLGGGGGWKQKVGDEDIIIRSTGRKVGLTRYPSVGQSGDRSEVTEHQPYKGPTGELLFPVTYSHEYIIIGGSGGGGGGGGGGSGPGFGQPPKGGAPTGGSIFGVQPGFSTTGITVGAAGGLAGERDDFTSISGS